MKVNLISLQFQPNIEVYKEWIKWHHSLGFDLIFIMDNNRTDFDNKTQPLPETYDNVKIIRMKSLGKNILGEQSCRFDYAKEYLKDCDYFIVLDSDEFLYFKDNQSVKTFLHRYDDIPFDQLGIPWKGMASDKALESGNSVIDDFKKSSLTGIPNNLYNDKQEPNCIKSFFRTKTAVDKNGCRDAMHTFGYDVKEQGLYSCNREKIVEHYWDHYKYNSARYNNSPAYIYHYRWTYLEDIRKNSIRYKASNFYGTNTKRLQKDRCIDKIPPNKLADMYETRMKEYVIEDNSMKNRKQELWAHPFTSEDGVSNLLHIHDPNDIFSR